MQITVIANVKIRFVNVKLLNFFHFITMKNYVFSPRYTHKFRGIRCIFKFKNKDFFKLTAILVVDLSVIYIFIYKLLKTIESLC
jgi:hypothetical protein